MSLQFRYRGKVVTSDDVAFIRQLILDNPNDSRWALSKMLCRAWNWVQPNGALKDMVCRGLMLELHRAGHIRLPAKKRRVNNPFVNRKKPAKVTIDHSPVDEKLSDIKPLRFCQVRRTGLEKLYNSLIEHYHYLCYCHPVGEQLKYIVSSLQRPIAYLAWSSAPCHIGCRDRFIGWSAHSRKANIHQLAYNTRFLILPGFRFAAWHRTYWPAWPKLSAKTGRRSTAIPSIFLKLLSTKWCPRRGSVYELDPYLQPDWRQSL